jgi:hypothetical protein
VDLFELFQIQGLIGFGRNVKNNGVFEKRILSDLVFSPNPNKYNGFV